MQGDEDRPVGAGEELHQLQLVFDVEVVGRLVQEQPVRLLGERARDVGPLPFTAGQALPGAPGESGESDAVERGGDDGPVVGVRSAPAVAEGGPPQSDDVGDAQVGVESGVLCDEGDPAGDPAGAQVRHGHAVVAHRTRVGHAQPGQAAQQ